MICDVIVITENCFFSAWIEVGNILPYQENKEQMSKLGKPKANFQKAINEIEAYIKNPVVSSPLMMLCLIVCLSRSFLF